MPSKNPIHRFNDIVYNIDIILRHVSGYDYYKYMEDEKTIDTVERCLQRITESSIKLYPVNEELLPNQDWKAMRDFGNLLRHHYEDVKEQEIWDIIENYLPELKKDCLRVIENLENKK